MSDEPRQLDPAKAAALLEAIGQGCAFTDQARAMSNEMLVSELQKEVLNHLSCLGKGYALLDEACMRLYPPLRNSAFPPAS